VVNFETDIAEPGRWQTYHSLAAPADADRDGMPDSREAQFGLNKNSAADAMQDADGDGYTNIEEYLNNTDPRGGSTPVIYVSASASRAYRQGGQAGEIRFTRTGATSAPVEVRYTLTGAGERWLTIPKGARSAALPVPPGKEDLVIATVAGASGYHLGVPRSALVAVENGPAPISVRLADIDPAGAPTEAARKRGAEQMQEHRLFKAQKIKGRKKN